MAFNGVKGRFRDRIRLIVINRYKKNRGIKDIKDNKDNNINDSNLKDNKDNRLKNNNIIGVSNNVDKSNDSFVKERISYINNKLDGDREEYKKKRYGFLEKEKNNNDDKKLNISDKELGVRKDIVSSDEKVKDDLKVKIIKKIKNKLNNNLCELDVLESELYFFDKDNDRELELEKVKEIKRKLDDIRKKIDNIMREYNIMKNNYYLEDVVDLDDKFLVDDIIEYKNILDSIDDNRNLVNDYKVLDEYEKLYEKLNDIDSVREELVNKNEKKIIDYSKRDRKYKIICDDIVKVDDVIHSVDYEIEKNNEYINELMSKVGNIDKNEYTIYKFKGLGDLIGNSLKYVGLMMISPFLGFLPSIAASTIATKKMIKNIRDNMGIEEIKRVNYVAENFNSDINNKLNDISYVYYVISDTLSEISRLKKDFLVQYNSNISGYTDTLNKINDIEEKIINNRRRVDIIKRKMLVSKKINEDKMIKIKKLNSNN